MRKKAQKMLFKIEKNHVNFYVLASIPLVGFGVL